MDVALAALGLLFLLPALLVIAGLLMAVDGRPLFFRHKRVGRNGQEFACIKFRTMRRDADAQLAALLRTDSGAQREWAEQRKLRRDPRIHLLGRFLRFTSLDELPQLVNVLRGEMSLVGPRPIILDELGLYGENLHYYLAMTPGVTGLWQVARTPETSYEARVAYDVEYFHKRSVAFDLGLIWKTVLIVLCARNVG